VRKRSFSGGLAGAVAIVTATVVFGVTTSAASVAGTLPTPTPAPTTTPAPTPTPATPLPGELISSANGATEAEGSVRERGQFRSVDNKVTPGFAFSAQLSWRRRVFRDNHRFGRPAYVKAFGGYVTDVRRVADQKRLSQRFDGTWTCSELATAKNAALWQPPSFSFASPKLVGTTFVRGRQAWDVRAAWSHGYQHAVTKLTIDVFIDETRNLYLESKESGTVSNGKGQRSAVSGSVEYSGYGLPVTGKLPPACATHSKKKPKKK